jgi:hypothetical protein
LANAAGDEWLNWTKGQAPLHTDQGEPCGEIQEKPQEPE